MPATQDARIHLIFRICRLSDIEHDRTALKVLTVIRDLGDGSSTRHVITPVMEKMFVVYYTSRMIICVSRGICQVPMRDEITNYKSRNLITGLGRVYDKPSSFYSPLKSLAKQIITA